VSSLASSEPPGHESEAERAAPTPKGAPDETQRLLSIQRGAGNRAVNRLLARRGLLQRQEAVEQAPARTPAQLDADIDDAELQDRTTIMVHIEQGCGARMRRASRFHIPGAFALLMEPRARKLPGDRARIKPG